MGTSLIVASRKPFVFWVERTTCNCPDAFVPLLFLLSWSTLNLKVQWQTWNQKAQDKKGKEMVCESYELVWTFIASGAYAVLSDDVVLGCHAVNLLDRSPPLLPLRVSLSWSAEMYMSRHKLQAPPMAPRMPGTLSVKHEWNKSFILKMLFMRYLLEGMRESKLTEQLSRKKSTAW